jgi:prepilin-type N-terminal cleavage/methylation domain-containing protein
MRLAFTLRGLRRLRSRLAEERAFSLIEALVVLLILGIVMSGLTTSFVAASRADLDANKRFQAQEQARLALDQLRRELHCATAVTDVSGGALATGSTYSAIKVALGSYCQTVTSTGFSTWCTAGSGPWSLYRIDHAVTSCSGSGSRKVASYLVAQLPFSKTTAPTGVGTQLPRLHVALTVNASGSSGNGNATLDDDIALRNATRS